MKKALTYTLAVALLLSLAACHKPQADQQDTSQPDPAAISTQADVSTPETPAQTPAAPEQLASTTQAKQPLSGDALIEYFQLTYNASSMNTSDMETEDAINLEIDVLAVLAENEGQLLPDDYADQYRAWRPVDEPPADTQTPTQSDPSKGQSQAQDDTQQNGGGTTQTTKPSGSDQTQTQQTQQQSKPSTPSSSSSDFDPYYGHGSYEAYIDYICEKYPDKSREEIMHKFPDQTKISVAPAAKTDAEAGLLTGN